MPEFNHKRNAIGPGLHPVLGPPLPWFMETRFEPKPALDYFDECKQVDPVWAMNAKLEWINS